MVVRFTDTPATQPPTDLPGLLRPQLSVTDRRQDDARSALLRALCVGLSADHSAVAIRRTISVLGAPEQVALASSRPAWAQLVRTARERVADQASEAGQYRNALAASRVTVARCCTPLPPGTLSPRREVAARRAMAAIGVQLAALRYDKVVVSAGWLAVQLGVSVEAARQTTRTLVELGWLSPAGRRGRAPRFRLRPLESEELRQRAWMHSDTVEEIAAGTGETALAQILIAASHPAIAYGSEALTGQVWVTWLHTLSGIPATETLGVSTRSRRASGRRTLPTPAVDLLDQLDDWAARGEAFTERNLVEARFKRAATETANRLASVRAERAARYQRARDARATIRAAVDAAGLPPTDRDAAQRWVPEFARALSGVAQTPELLIELRSLMSARGWSEQMVDAAVRYLERDAA